MSITALKASTLRPRLRVASPLYRVGLMLHRRNQATHAELATPPSLDDIPRVVFRSSNPPDNELVVRTARNCWGFQPRLLINGKLVGSSNKETFPLYNPATREKLIDVPEASEDDLNAAVAAAKAAFPAWSALAPQERGSCLKRLAVLIGKHAEELGRLEAVCTGRPVSNYFDAFLAANYYEHFAEAWTGIQGTANLNTPGYMTMTLRQPYGVVGAIIPWNVSVFSFAGKTAPALIAGNTVVLKSSEKAPLAAARVAELVQEAGFPPGVLNVLSGHGTLSGAAMSRHMDVRAISFTGSCHTGRAIQEAAATSNMKKIVLELGGKSPAIIFPDAPDLEQAVNETAYSIQWNSGQVCVANSRVYVHKSIRDKYIELFKERFTTYNAGDPLDLVTTHGPLVDEKQYRKAMDYIDNAKAEGQATLEAGGSGRVGSLQGYYIEPTIFVDTPEDSRVMKEEIFGPVVCINTFETEEEAIRLANDTEFGLYASVYTGDVSRAMRIAKALESGYVAVNCTSPFFAPDQPFGGYKGSGQGREGFLHSLDNWLETKSVAIKIAVDKGGHAICV